MPTMASSRSASIFVAMFRWVSGKALGEPVVPDVQDSSAGSSPPVAGRSPVSSTRSERQFSASGALPSMRIVRLPQARRMSLQTSKCGRVVKRGFPVQQARAVRSCSGSARSSIGTRTPPAARTARATMIHAGELDAHSATASPVLTPDRRSPCASLRASPARLALSQVKVPASPTATTAGCRPRAASSCSRVPTVQGLEPDCITPCRRNASSPGTRGRSAGRFRRERQRLAPRPRLASACGRSP